MREKTAVSAWGWLLIALVSHTLWGTHPVFARYLQTVSHLPSLSILVLAYGLPFVIFGFFILPRLDRHVYRSPLLWQFGAVSVVRGLSNQFAARYTLSVFVQIVTQTTPFWVVLLSVLLLREATPRYTRRAVALTFIGSALMMGESLLAGWRLGTVGGINGRYDLLGIFLAIISSIALAAYMLIVRRSRDAHIPSEAIMLMQFFVIASSSTILSILWQEDWRGWLTIGLWDIVAFLGLSIGVFVLANLSQIIAIRHIGAPRVSSLMSWRLLSTFAIGTLFLDERLTSPWQFTGMLIVFATITWYLWQQR